MSVADAGPQLPAVVVGDGPVTIEQILALADGDARVRVTTRAEVRARIERGARLLADRLADGGTVYGVTTGFGDSCETDVPRESIAALPYNLMRFHGCGTGRIFNEQEAAAVLAVRLAALAGGWSGVRLVVLERLCDLINHRVLPQIPAEGSVGASGDLTPLSYVVAALVGERECTYRGEVMDAAAALAAAGVEPLELRPKDSLALMNGTSVMTALGCLAYARARRLARFAAAITAVASDVTRGNPAHFNDRIFAAKAHPGQRACARWIRDDLEYDRREGENEICIFVAVGYPF